MLESLSNKRKRVAIKLDGTISPDYVVDMSLDEIETILRETFTQLRPYGIELRFPDKNTLFQLVKYDGRTIVSTWRISGPRRMVCSVERLVEKLLSEPRFSHLKN